MGKLENELSNVFMSQSDVAAWAATFTDPLIPFYVKIGNIYGLEQGPDEAVSDFQERVANFVVCHHHSE